MNLIRRVYYRVWEGKEKWYFGSGANNVYTNKNLSSTRRRFKWQKARINEIK